MQFSTLALAALASLASAQVPNNSRFTVVQVAPNGTQTFSPSNVRVNVGEFVQFQFVAGNHTVTQSTFDQPCQPIAMHNPNVTGFHSGYQPAAASAAMGMFPTFTIQINSTNPVWIYCGQGRHCENGMVMVINEPANNPNRTLAAHKLLAAQANTVVPGSGVQGGNNGQGNGAPGTPGTTTDTPVDPNAGATSSAGLLSAPGLLMLLAAAGFASLL